MRRKKRRPLDPALADEHARHQDDREKLKRKRSDQDLHQNSVKKLKKAHMADSLRQALLQVKNSGFVNISDEGLVEKTTHTEFCTVNSRNYCPCQKKKAVPLPTPVYRLPLVPPLVDYFFAL